MKAEDLKKRISSVPTKDLTLEILWEHIKDIPFSNLEYRDILPAVSDPSDYARNILSLDPIELVLIRWPEGVASGIHHHHGFFGFVITLEGQLDNVLYRERGDRLEEYEITRYLPVSAMAEGDDVIHKIVNSGRGEAVSLHIYYPPLENFDGMRLFNLESRSAGILSKEAETASWSDKPGHFKAVEKNAFDYVPFEECFPAQSHVILPLVPKPASDEVDNCNRRYFSEQAGIYDDLDKEYSWRDRYVKGVDRLIVDDIRKRKKVDKYLSICCGTGRRVLSIREESGIDFDVYGVDLSGKMCELAGKKGIPTFNCSFQSPECIIDDKYDIITFLYAFGHIPDGEQRLAALKKARSLLNPGGVFYADLFNLGNKYEWGPDIRYFHEKYFLRDQGYDEGDVFYKRKEGRELAYLHYFTRAEIEDLLKKAGFSQYEISIIGYSEYSGRILENEDEGSYLIKAWV